MEVTIMETIKELNTSSYEINSKYKRHTGINIRHGQKSRSHKADHSRKWRKRIETNRRRKERKDNKNLIKSPVYNSAA